jgi:hypothetical protein
VAVEAGVLLLQLLLPSWQAPVSQRPSRQVAGELLLRQVVVVPLLLLVLPQQVALELLPALLRRRHKRLRR